MGDPTGVGPEVTLKAIEQIDLPVDILVIGSVSIIDETKARYNIKWNGEVLNCVDIDKSDIEYGKPSRVAGKCAYESILKGYELVAQREIDALVTAPICKASISFILPSFSGHTELLANLAGVEKFAMMLVGDTLRVTLVTTHISIKEVARSLDTDDIVSKVELTHQFLSQKLRINSPKIGVCALNPHGGEEIFGDEEKRVIIPAIEKVKSMGIDVSGPYPADTVFIDHGAPTTNKFDAIVSMYHDQGMIPLKIKEFGNAVNVTLGLPFVRTSPDHGTAFDVAGKGIANPTSMIKAIKLAIKLAQPHIKDG